MAHDYSITAGPGWTDLSFALSSAAHGLEDKHTTQLVLVLTGGKYSPTRTVMVSSITVLEPNLLRLEGEMQYRDLASNNVQWVGHTATYSLYAKAGTLTTDVDLN